MRREASWPHVPAAKGKSWHDVPTQITKIRKYDIAVFMMILLVNVSFLSWSVIVMHREATPQHMILLAFMSSSSSVILQAKFLFCLFDEEFTLSGNLDLGTTLTEYNKCSK